MPKLSRFYSVCIVLVGIALCAASGPEGSSSGPVNSDAPGPFGARSFPYEAAGLTKRQAAAHLLNRFTYGATTGEVDAVVHMGLENWFRRQLGANLPDDSLNALLSQYDALKLSNSDIVNTYPRPGQVLLMAARDGVISKDSLKADRKNYLQVLKAYEDEHGLKPERELFRQFICQKILRAACTDNQLQEVMTDFWFNHFNVSMTKNDCADFIPDYERDVIRPNVLGKFGDLLLATAKSPAMLYYLDNFSSSAPAPQGQMMAPSNAAAPDDTANPVAAQVNAFKRNVRGLNENYAREVMELHTLGVDGGYTQTDVTEAARVFTGWTVYPMGEFGRQAAARIEKVGEARLERAGFVHDGDFLFNANRHDKGVKTVLDKTFGPDGGYQEGVELLEMLAHHPSTAHFICRELAVRFVSDNPPQDLVDRMAQTFLARDGDIRQVLVTMVSSPEFWSPQAVRQKIKSPFELTIGAVRSLHATIDQPYQLYNWMTKMGEKLYTYQAPTGFPDKAQYWINTGSLLNRMNFGLALASNRIPGVHADLAALNDNREPESAEAALATYAKILLPERDLGPTIKRLTPLLEAPGLEQKVGGLAEDSAQVSESPDELAQVVGILIGSPEFQRR